MSENVTRETVARLAGTSPAVVSYVVNNGPRPVAAATRQRVLDAIAQTGYRPNVIAKALASGASGTVGLVVPDISNPLFAELVKAIQVEVSRSGRVLLVANASPDPAVERRVVSSLIERQVESLLYFGAGHHHSLEDATRAGIPVVLLDRREPGSDTASVVVDDFDGAVTATSHLIGHGRSRIAIVAGPSSVFSSAERIGGWRKALKSAGLPNGDDLFFSAELSRAGGYEVAEKLLGDDMPDAVVVANELQAMGLLAAAGERGIRVPEDVAIITFDGTEQSLYTSPALTTVAPPLAEIARRAVSMTGATSTNGKRNVTCDFELVRRRSCGCTTEINENRQVRTQMEIFSSTWRPPPKEESSMNKNIGIVAGASVALAAMTLAGCSSPSTPTPTPAQDEVATITFVTPHQGVFDDAVAAFEKAHPNITVEIQVIPFAEVAAQTQARLGAQDSSIDVIAVDPPKLPGMAEKGFFLDVSADKAAMDEELTAGGVSSVTWDDHQYGYPLWTSDNFLFYNKALLESAGIEAPGAASADRWTWEDTISAAQKAQAAGAQYGFAFEQVDAFYAMQPVIMSMGGGSGLKGDGNLTPDVASSGWTKFGAWYGDLYESGLSPRGIASAQMPDLFKSGSVAFYVAGPARITDLQKSDLKDGWGMAPLPYAAGGKAVTPTDSWAVAVSAYSEHQAAAQEFARYLSLDADGAESISTKFNLPPVNQKAYPKYIHYITGIAPDQTEQYGNLLTADSDENAQRRPSSIAYVDFETVVNKAFADIRNGGDSAALLEAAQADLERQLAQYQ